MIQEIEFEVFGQNKIYITEINRDCLKSTIYDVVLFLLPVLLLRISNSKLVNSERKYSNLKMG